jgi:hypothetical protein
MADIVQSLFGVTPEIYQQSQQARADQQALQYAQLTPFQQANFAIGRGATMLGGAAGRALGGEDPELARISMRQQIARQLNPNDPASIQQAISALSQAGDGQGAMMLQGEYQKLIESNALVGQRGAAEKASLAQAAKTNLTIKQEEELRDKLSKLVDPTEAQILSIVTQYGSPDKVLATLQGSADRAAQRETNLTLGREKIAAKLESDLRDAKNDKEKEQARIDARKELALLMAALKGPSAAVLKAQEKADKAAEGQLALSDTIATAETLVKDLAKMGGMTSTSKGPLANLVTSLQTGTVGQVAGRTFGTKEQAKRDELKSVRLQLLNAVKEATGMSSQQLNSNVELKTYLDSLGSEGMSKEANLAILENLSRRYLKGGANMPSGGTGTAENPIVLK